MEQPFLMFLDHTQRRSTVGRPLPDNTRHSQQTNIHAPGGPKAARLLRSWVRIPPGAWIFVCC